MKNPMMLKCLLCCCFYVVAWLPAEAITVCDVKASPYYAVGDGIHNDTPNIKMAFDAVPSGGEIYFPPGTYLIDNTLVLASNKIGVTIKMSGGFSQAVGRNMQNDRGLFWSSTAHSGIPMLNLTATSGTTQLIGLCMDGGGGANEPTGLYLASGNNVTSTGVWIRNCNIGMDFEQGQTGVLNFYNCLITNCNYCVNATPSAPMLFDACTFYATAGNNSYYCISQFSGPLQLISPNFVTNGTQTVINTIPANNAQLPVCSLTITGGHSESTSVPDLEHSLIYFFDTTLSRSGPISITGFQGDGDVDIEISPTQNILLACNTFTGLAIAFYDTTGQHYCNRIEGINYSPTYVVPSGLGTISTGPDTVFEYTGP